MIDLAVGIIMGAAFTAIVDSAVTDLVMAPVGLILGGIDFSNLFVQLTGRGTIHATLKAAQTAGVVTLNVGLFVNAVIKFAIVAWAVFLLVKAVNTFMKKQQAAAPAAPAADVVLLTEIRDLLKSR